MTTYVSSSGLTQREKHLSLLNQTQKRGKKQPTLISFISKCCPQQYQSRKNTKPLQQNQPLIQKVKKSLTFKRAKKQHKSLTLLQIKKLLRSLTVNQPMMGANHGATLYKKVLCLSLKVPYLYLYLLVKEIKITRLVQDCNLRPPKCLCIRQWSHPHMTNLKVILPHLVPSLKKKMGREQDQAS